MEFESMLNKNIKTVFLSILISALVCSQIGNSAYIGDSDTVMRLGKFSITPYSYIVERFNSTHYQSINASGYVFRSTNATNVLQFAWDNCTLTGGGDVFVKTGEYDLGTSQLILRNGAYTPSVRLIGEGHPSRDCCVVFKGNDTKMVSSNRTVASGYQWGANHVIENIRFEHNTQASSDITLSLDFITVELTHVTVSNTNATRQGMGIWNGGYNASMNSGQPITWTDVASSWYGTGIQIGIDHLTMINTLIYDSANYALYINRSAWNVYINTKFAWASSTPNSCYTMYFDAPAQHNNFFGVNVEASGKTFNQTIITYDGSGHNVLIDGFFMQGTLGAFGDLDHPVTFWNRTDSNSTAEYFIHLNANAGSYLSEYAGHNNDVVDGQYIAHGLLNTPYFAMVLNSDASLTEISLGIKSENATHIRIGAKWGNGTVVDADHSPVDIWWYASINRR